jgi:hypothetical protein
MGEEQPDTTTHKKINDLQKLLCGKDQLSGVLGYNL